MQKTESNILQLINFTKLTKWSANAISFRHLRSAYPLVPLSKVITRIKEPIAIEDERKYKRITVRLYGQGVLLRDEVYGRDIGTKRQFIARAGQLIISRIDARNGAFGVVPIELDGAIVTNDFWLFDVNNAMPLFVMLILSSNHFQKHWQTQSSGTTNRQRVDETNFLETKIPLPSLYEQHRIIDAYSLLLESARDTDSEITLLNNQIVQSLLESLKVEIESLTFGNVMGFVQFQNISRWDPQYLSSKVTISSIYPLVPISSVVKNLLVDENGASLRRDTHAETDTLYLYIGMEHVEKGTGKCKYQKVHGSDILSQTVHVPYNYVIFGKLRPYLNKYWENKTTHSNVICSSEFLVFDTHHINRDYFIEILSSHIIQKQLPSLYSGARMPRITESDFLNLQIPLPPPNVQADIVKKIKEIRNRISQLTEAASIKRAEAKRQFEEAVFGET